MLTTMTRPLAAAMLAALLLFTACAQAADPPATTITVPEMDCASCAKKVGGKVAEVTGVAKVEYDVKARTLKVTHKAGATPSPKALWEAVGRAAKTRASSKPRTAHTRRSRRVEGRVPASGRKNRVRRR